MIVSEKCLFHSLFFYKSCSVLVLIFLLFETTFWNAMLKKLILILPFVLFSGVYLQPDYTAILMNRSVLEESVKLAGSPKIIANPGKIYLYKNWIFLVERYKGIHLIDNTDPVNPVIRDFLMVPGCMDVAVGNGILYVDNSVDLVGVSVDFSRMKSLEVCRKKKILPEINSPYGYIPSTFSRRNRPPNTEIVGWIDNYSDSNDIIYYE